MTESPLADRGIPFVLKMGRALHLYGTPAHRLEESMSDLARVLGLDAHIFATPTAIFSSFPSDHESHIDLQRIDNGEADLSKLSELHDLASAVVRGDTTPRVASARIDEILAAPSRYAPWMIFASFGLTSAAASRFFGGGGNEMLLALVVGLVVGAIALAAGRWAAVARLFEPLSGIAVSFLAVAGSALVASSSVPIVTVAGLIVLVPGLTLTTAVSELAQRNLVSGTARLHSALIVFLMLGFGVALGGKVGTLLTGPLAAVRPAALPGWTEAVSVLVAGITLSILFRAPRRDLGWIIGIGSATYATVRFASPLFGPELGVFLAALTVGVGSNLHARILDRPSAVTRLPGMMLLVPGGLGFLSISSLMHNDVVAGVQGAFTVAVIAVALVTGLLVSNAIVPPGRKF